MLVCVSFKEWKESWESVEELGAFCKREPYGQGSRRRTRGEVGGEQQYRAKPTAQLTPHFLLLSHSNLCYGYKHATISDTQARVNSNCHYCSIIQAFFSA